MEFPIYSWTGGALARLFGSLHLWLHMVTLLSGLLGIWFLFRIVGRLFDPLAGASAALALAFSPVYFFYNYKIIPDITMLALTLAATWSYLRFLDSGALWRVLLAAILLAAAAAIKPLALAVCLPLLIIACNQPSRRIPHAARLLLFSVIVTAAAALWIRYAVSLSRTHHLWAFEMRSHLDRLPDLLASGRFFERLLLQWPWELWIGWLLAPAFIYGLVRLIRERRALIILSWVAACYIVFLLTALKATSHDYYTLIVVPPFAAITGVGLSRLLSSVGWRRTIAIIMIVLAPVMAVARVAHRFGPTDEFDSLRTGAAALIPLDQRVIVEDQTPIVRLYALDRYGWPVAPNSISADSIVAYIQSGAHWLLLSHPAGIPGDLPDSIIVTPADAIGSLTVYRLDRR